MTYVYILRSIPFPTHHYVGIANDLRARPKKHNSREVPHTSNHAPWAIKTYIAFADRQQASAFECYLKTPSGRAFSHQRH